MSTFKDRMKEAQAKKETFEKLGLDSVMQSAVNDGILQGIDFATKLVLEYYDKSKTETMTKRQIEYLLEGYKEMAKKHFV
tara:strand:- start:602 stop:841 length:240 start_codon:yes stop_codon:yes gene_type:complete